MHSMESAPPTDFQMVPALEGRESVGISRNQSESVGVGRNQSESVELGGRDQVAVTLAWLPYQRSGTGPLHKD